MARLVARSGPRSAIVNGQFLEVGQNGQGDLGAPSVAAKLVGRGRVRADVDAAFLSLGEKFRQGTDSEGVIGSLLLAFHVQAVLGNYFTILGGVPLPVAHVPAQGFKEW